MLKSPLPGRFGIATGSHLVKSAPGASLHLTKRVPYSPNLEHKNQIQTMKRLYWLFAILLNRIELARRQLNLRLNQTSRHEFI